MSKQKPIQDYSVGYNVLRAYTKMYLRMFYGKTTIIGTENIPDDKPVIFAINHQNALMDALTTLSAVRKQPVFMARADIFNAPVVAKILRWLKILPIFRIRDGVKSLQNNEAIFEEAIGVLNDKKILGILPEGNHGDQKRLRVLKKGIARIAFQAEERKNFKLDVQIVPVGLDFSHYINFGSHLLMYFGKPFSISSYKELYLENDQKGMNAFMQDLRNKMLPQMLHIDDSENYDGIKALIDYYTLHLKKNKGYKPSHLNQMLYQQKLSAELLKIKGESEEKFNDITDKANAVNKGVEKLKFRQWVLTKDKYSFLGILGARLLQLIFFPVYLYGFMTNIIQFQLPVLFSRGVKDPQFLSSFRFVLGMIIFTLMYLIYLILLLIFVPNWLLAIAISLTIPLFGILSFKYYKWFKKTSAKFRTNRLHRKNNSKWIKMREDYNSIIDFMSTNMPKA